MPVNVPPATPTVAVPTNDEFTALAARVTALESGSVKPPDPPNPSQPSPDGTTITTVGPVLITAKGNKYALYANAPQGGMGITYNGTADTATHHVGKLYAKGGLCYQQETTRGDWYVGNEPGWSPASDPTAGTGPVPPNPNPPPGTGPNLVALYTRSPGNETWNFGNGADKDKLLDQGISIYESDVGHAVNAYLMFPMWGSMNDWGKWNLNGMLSAMKNNSAKAKNYVPIVGLKPFWNGVDPKYYAWNDKQGLLDTANGMWDQIWRDCVDACANNGFNTTVWRLGYEDNFGFMVSFAGYSADNQQTAWKAAFERMADVIHDQAKKRGIVAQVAFNPTLGRGGCTVEDMTPNAAKFDIYAIDAYNSYYGDSSNWQNDPNERQNFWSTSYFGFNHALANAKALGKPLAILEHGAGVRSDGHSLKNSDNFWKWSQKVIGQARAQGVRYVCSAVWDVPASDINCATSNGAQPPCVAQLKANMADGSMVGEPLWLPATAAATADPNATPTA